MPLSRRLDSPAALYRKLEREAYRAYHAKTPLQKSDHFYNFCVTASSMRDYCHEHAGRLTKPQRKQQESIWWQQPLLAATFEIANSTKHFVLREQNSGAPKMHQTKTVRSKNSGFVEIYLSKSGEVKTVPVRKPDVSVTLSDGKRYDLYQFTREVLAYWGSYLVTQGIKLRRQSLAQLAGSTA